MSHQVRLDDDVYEQIKANKRDGESFSDAVKRLIGGRSLRELRDVFDEDQGSEMRDAIKATDRKDRDEVRDVSECFE
jgi:predicted CopG family antitoxin